MKPAPWIFVLIVWFLIPGVQAAPQNSEYDNLAILGKGPLSGKGIPNLYPNALDFYYGLYRYKTFTIEIFYSSQKVLPSESWEPFVCGQYRLLKVPVKTGWYLYYEAGTGWVVFLKGPADLALPCPFIEIFIKRLSYFMGISKDKVVVPFPAVLEIK